MKCPHCQTTFHDNPSDVYLGEFSEGRLAIMQRCCPECDGLILHLCRAKWIAGRGYLGVTEVIHQLHPKQSARSALPSEVPADFADDYKEACLVLSESPKASAALSRRCLQHILQNAAGIQKPNLHQEIQEAIKQLPSHIAESLDAVRVVGNFSAHPMKSTASGEIIEVEPGEAEWNLEVLESLFDFYFVQPALVAKRKAALNQKLKEAGKPELK